MSIFNNTITPTNEELKSKYGFIYVTVNNINNKIYVGQKKFNSSWKSYLGSGVSLNHSIKKYGKENFTRHIIEICHEEEIDNQEIHWIYELNAMDKNIGYNLCEGGRTTRGFKYSDEQKEVNRIRRLELWKDPEYRKKMSKSLGNIINPLMLIDEFGVDSVRYYLMSEMVLGLDATFSMDSFVKKYNSDLANDLGNLVSRVCTLISNNFDDKMPSYKSKDSDLSKSFDAIDMKQHLDHFQMDSLLHKIMNFVRSVNGYMEKNQPWKLVKEDKESAGHILYHAAESLRVAAIMLSPVMPEKSKEIKML